MTVRGRSSGSRTRLAARRESAALKSPVPTSASAVPIARSWSTGRFSMYAASKTSASDGQSASSSRRKCAPDLAVLFAKQPRELVGQDDPPSLRRAE